MVFGLAKHLMAKTTHLLPNDEKIKMQRQQLPDGMYDKKEVCNQMERLKSTLYHAQKEELHCTQPHISVKHYICTPAMIDRWR